MKKSKKERKIRQAFEQKEFPPATQPTLAGSRTRQLSGRARLACAHIANVLEKKRKKENEDPKFSPNPQMQMQ